MNSDSHLQDRVFPHEYLRKLLNSVEKPGRYVGGEYGAITHLPAQDDFKIAVIFPDLYEIGMSNHAIRILYRLFNEKRGLHAERAFSPGPDFQKGLKDLGLSISSLENAIPMSDFDVLAITIGIELAFTNLLSFLDGSGIPLRSDERRDNHPLIITGGPAMTNPAPWLSFIDAAFIGEAEECVAEDMLTLRELKLSGASRSDLLAKLSCMDGYYTSKNPQARKISWTGFSNQQGPPPAFPIPSMTPVQDHGTVEIMRGCPNKCRFCHAGVFYRPFRQKNLSRILEETDFLINHCGHRDITLSSLSTGDYIGLEPLVERLNSMYSKRHVSFSLPSLRVNSITLSLIGRLGVVRRSGLTFAVETPTKTGQMGINKEVPADRVVEILLEAKREGWKLAKFYFMLGLPVDNGISEVESIIEYLLSVQRKTGMILNVNLGTFIPKPHTPFERAAQLTDDQAMAIIRQIRDGLRCNKKIRYTFQSPFVSLLEGIISRGDRRAGELAFEAWKKGAAFDSWDDRMNKQAWKDAIEEADWDVEEISCRVRGPEESLPWDGVSLGVTAAHLKTESERGGTGESTVPCAVKCTDHCGVCNKNCKVIVPDLDTLNDSDVESALLQDSPGQVWKRMLITFTKSGPAVYLGHLDLLGVFEKALQRAGITIDFTQGFNPKPRIEFAQPLSLGISSEGEICTIKLLSHGENPETISRLINKDLPSGIKVVRVSWIPDTGEGSKKHKVMGVFWGSDWRLSHGGKSKSVEDKLSEAHALASGLNEACRSRGVLEDIQIDVQKSDLFIRLRHGGTRHHNLINLLESVLGLPPLTSDWAIVRTKCWAKNSIGNPVSYDDFFPETSGSVSIFADSQ